MLTELPELITPRLVLRPWRPQDVPDAFQHGSDAEWSRYLPEIPRPYELHHAEAFVAAAIQADPRVRTEFAVEHDRRVVGAVRLTWDSGSVRDSGRAGVAYSLARSHWGKGFAREAVSEVIRYGFEERGLDRITAEIDARNDRSLALALRLGMRREGLLRAHWLYPAARERADVVFVGLLRDEWRSSSDRG